MSNTSLSPDLLTAHLSLPDGVADAPQSRYGEEQFGVVGMGTPHDQDPYEYRVNNETQHHQRQSSDVLHNGSEQQRAYCVDHAKAYHHVPDGWNAQGAGHVRLKPTWCFGKLTL